MGEVPLTKMDWDRKFGYLDSNARSGGRGKMHCKSPSDSDPSISWINGVRIVGSCEGIAG
jgi:hypothetical protein